MESVFYENIKEKKATCTGCTKKALLNTGKQAKHC